MDAEAVGKIEANPQRIFFVVYFKFLVNGLFVLAKLRPRSHRNAIAPLRSVLFRKSGMLKRCVQRGALQIEPFCFKKWED